MTYPEDAQSRPDDAMPPRVSSRCSADRHVSPFASAATVRAPQRPAGPSANVPRPPPGGDGLLLDFAQEPAGRYGARVWWECAKRSLIYPPLPQPTVTRRPGCSGKDRHPHGCGCRAYKEVFTACPGRGCPVASRHGHSRRHAVGKEPQKSPAQGGAFSALPNSQSIDQPISSADHGSACTSCRCRTGTDRCGRPSAHRG